jgi:transposase
MLRTILSDELWDKLKELLPKPKGRHGNNDRLFIEAVFWIIRTGSPWRDMPSEYGSWKTTYNRFNNWVKKGHLDEILEVLKKEKKMITNIT